MEGGGVVCGGELGGVEEGEEELREEIDGGDAGRWEEVDVTSGEEEENIELNQTITHEQDEAEISAGVGVAAMDGGNVGFDEVPAGRINEEQLSLSRISEDTNVSLLNNTEELIDFSTLSESAEITDLDFSFSELDGIKYKKLLFLLTNARSLSPKINSLIQYFADFELDLAVITESWLASGIRPRGPRGPRKWHRSQSYL